MRMNYILALVLLSLVLCACSLIDKPNAVTAKAIREGRAMARDKNCKGYTDMVSLRKALEN